METSEISVMAQDMNRQAFGAAVVIRTLDTLNSAGPSPVPTDARSFDAAVVGKTLDTMNNGQGPGMVDMKQTL